MYYFFKTSMENRGGEMKPTLRALPGQFLNGKPIDTELNVRAPKEAGASVNGNRLDYPDGTAFCSNHLELDTSKATPFYSVYNGTEKDPEFHPVSENPSFSYVSPTHKNDEMNAAYVLFINGFNPNEEEMKTEKETKTSAAIFSPCDEDGKARPVIENWKERYDGQIEEETNIFAKWLRTLFNEKKVTPAERILMNSCTESIKKLYTMGETIDTLASRARFEKFLNDNKISYSDFEILKAGPHKKYIEFLLEEHESRKECSAKERDYNNPLELNDTLSIVLQAHEDLTGSSYNGDLTKDTENIKKALADGWTVNDIIDPENLKKAFTFSEYAEALATGKIEQPTKIDAAGASYIDLLLTEKKFNKPKDKDGFHVEDKLWKILVRNINRKQNTMLVGPTGCGKTDIIRRYCKQTGTDLTIIQMGSITDPTEQLVGKMDIDTITGGTVFDWAEFAKAIQKPGIILLDEINRIPKNGENLLFNCLDNCRTLSASNAKSSDKREISVHPDCCFIATANIGDEFTGTKPIDAAIESRFMKVELDYLTQAQEKKMLVIRQGISDQDAENITLVATQIRKLAKKEEMKSISTRYTLDCAALVKDGFSCLEAMEIVFLPLYDVGAGEKDATSERAAVRAIIQQRMNNKTSV